MGERKDDFDVIVVGGGPTGIMAAGRAAQKGARVLLLEKMGRVGRKLLITGKGRCNITYDGDMEEYFENIFPNPRFLKHAFHSFFKDEIMQIMSDQGVEITTERGKRVFPVSNQASDVLDALLRWMDHPNIKILTQAPVQEIIIENSFVKGVSAMTDRGLKVFYAPGVIICTGGKSYPATGSTGDGYHLAEKTGHRVISPLPALVPLVTEGDLASKLQGLALKNINASVWVNGKRTRQEFGELMFAHYGLTGPVILTLSRFITAEIENGNKVEVSIDLKPALDEKKLDNRLIRDLNEHGKKQLENAFKLWLPSSMIPVFIELVGLDGKTLCNQVDGKTRRRILNLLKDFRFDIKGHPGFKEAIITAGGVSLKDIDSKTMESKKVKGLFFAGEVLDLDGNTGGFNLQIAWSTGWLAGDMSFPNRYS